MACNCRKGKTSSAPRTVIKKPTSNTVNRNGKLGTGRRVITRIVK